MQSCIIPLGDTEMLAGSIILEDRFIQFTVLSDDSGIRSVGVTVSDTVTGDSEIYRTSEDAFFLALNIALTDPEVNEAVYDLAESAMPSNPDLRWIP